MSSLPGAYFYTNDLYADTAQCTDSTVGIWALLLCIMVKRGSGTLVDTPKALRLACRTTPRSWNRAMEELDRYGIAEVEMVPDCDLIRIHSSRMERTIAEALAGYNSEKEVRRNRLTLSAKNRHKKSDANSVNESVSPENEHNVTPSRALARDIDLDRSVNASKGRVGSPRERLADSGDAGPELERPTWAPSEESVARWFRENGGLGYKGDHSAAELDGRLFWAHCEKNAWREESGRVIRNWKGKAKAWMIRTQRGDFAPRGGAGRKPEAASLDAFPEMGR